MTLASAHAGLTGDPALAQVTRLLIEVTGEDATWAARVGADSRLEADLRLESIEVTALAGLLADASGGHVDLLAFIRGLSIDEILALTVGDIAALIAAPLTADTAVTDESAGASAAGSRGTAERAG
jgi:acyl carrier protein